MSYLRRVDAAKAAEWPDLVDELDRWAAAGRVATLWWRDDDAVAATPELQAMLRLAGDIPVALAVIPALARPELAAALKTAPHAIVLQHGWQHANRALNGKKSEYPPGRDAAAVAAEIATGRERLTALFGARALPVLVPPWNRIAGEFLPLLPEVGIRGLSVIAANAAVMPPGLAALDVHIDLVAWREGRGFIGAAPALGRLVGHLQAARFGADDATRPIGILTHHLVQDDATTAFLQRLVALTGSHGAVRWAAAGECLQ
jgi:hypothetical protein